MASLDKKMQLAESDLGCVIDNVKLPTDWTLSERDLCDLEMLLMGAFHPLKGYMTFKDYVSVLNNCRLADGKVWPMPIVLAISNSSVNKSENAQPIRGQRIKLRDSVGTIVAEIEAEDCFEPNIDNQMKLLLGTTEQSHPYVKFLKGNHTDVVYVGGSVKQIHPILHFDFRDIRSTPSEIKEKNKAEGKEIVIGFQTRNPMHRSHFELTRQALKEVSEESVGKKVHLLLSPACGPTQPGDVKYHVRVRCYKKLLPYYQDYKNGSVDLVLLPLAMRMAGPKEALWHALIRRNYGCSHFIVGRDHAGPSTRRSDGSPFYGPYEAHELLKSLQKEIGIIPVFGRNMLFLGDDNGGYVQEDRVPKGVKSLEISGTQFRKMLENRDPVPDWFSFKPVVEELQTFYKQKSSTGFCLYFTGLPCSGKSTLATAVEAALQERGSETRQVTVLDADVIRTHLSKGLGFSRLDRQLNVRRIGYVSSEIVKHGGICIVANIAPYEEDRQYNRQLVESMGGYIEVYVSTPLAICEQRDVKELYKKARLGVIKQFTGISDPYEVPVSPELIINSSCDVIGKVDQVVTYLKEKGWIL